MNKLPTMFVLVLISMLASATTPLQLPTAVQVDPQLVCTNGEDLIPAVSTGFDGGFLIGTAHKDGFYCKLRVHSGRGPGYRVVSICAEVMWDFNGAIVTVTPTAAKNGYSIVCP